jgi:predicted transcriptional regulator of viral defense system
MKLSVFFAKVKTLNQPIFTTRDVVTLLDLETSTASKTLRRLTDDKHLISLRSGVWALPGKIEPFMLPEYLTSPYPSYVSLQSALYYHGMIEQIPNVVYAVTLARTKRFVTPFATISVHHIKPEFFFGFDVVGKNNIKIATPEKALMDFFYLSPAKSGWFASLPELTLPKKFNFKLCEKWLKVISSKRRRVLVENKLNSTLKLFDAHQTL